MGEKDKESGGLAKIVPLWDWTDLDQRKVWRLMVAWRLFQCFFLTSAMAHPDEYW
jgi:hypothetical protein